MLKNSKGWFKLAVRALVIGVKERPAAYPSLEERRE